MAEASPSRRRHVVGIDLGTTNSALCSSDTGEAAGSAGGRRELVCLAVPQLVGPGLLGTAPTLPSLHHHVGEHELPDGATRLPWTPPDAPAPQHVVGELARQQAQAVPGRSVSSAKSWLCHPRVDRLADILPWGGMADVPRLSPVKVSARWPTARPGAAPGTAAVVPSSMPRGGTHRARSGGSRPGTAGIDAATPM